MHKQSHTVCHSWIARGKSRNFASATPVYYDCSVLLHMEGGETWAGLVNWTHHSSTDLRPSMDRGVVHPFHCTAPYPAPPCCAWVGLHSPLTPCEQIPLSFHSPHGTRMQPWILSDQPWKWLTCCAYTLEHEGHSWPILWQNHFCASAHGSLCWSVYIVFIIWALKCGLPVGWDHSRLGADRLLIVCFV